jgi:hypothetical protein
VGDPDIRDILFLERDFFFPAYLRDDTPTVTRGSGTGMVDMYTAEEDRGGLAMDLNSRRMDCHRAKRSWPWPY